MSPPLPSSSRRTSSRRSESPSNPDESSQSFAPHQQPVEAWSGATSQLWQGMGLGLDLQRQSMERWVLRQQEWMRHLSSPLGPGAWVDASLAGMRWSFQEWEQSTQDLMTAMLLMRGDLGRDRVDPLLMWCGQVAQQPWQAWSELWGAAGRRPSG